MPDRGLRALEGGASDVGRARRLNEDYFGWSHVGAGGDRKDGVLYVVADGVGGQAAGEVASRLAVETFLEAYRAHPSVDTVARLRQAMAEANRAVYESGRKDGRATTLVAAAVVGGALHVANVGDSRLYFVRGESVRQVTLDHSWVQEQVRAGLLSEEAAARHPRGNVITRWLGQPEVEPDTFVLPLEPEDRIVLCTDGLFKHVSEDAIRRVVLNRPEQAAADELVQLANAGGGSDNVTVVVVRLTRSDAAVTHNGRPTEPAARLPSPPARRLATGRRRGGLRPWVVRGLIALLLAFLAVLATLLLLDRSDGTVPLSGSPVAIALGPRGAVYVADQSAGEVVTLEATTLVRPQVRLLGLRPIPSSRWRAGENGKPPSSLTGLAVGPTGTVYVSDGGSNRIRAFDGQGSFLFAWGESGAEPGHLNRPTGLAVDGAGNVYVADAGNRRVQSFSHSGAFLRTWTLDVPETGRARDVSSVAVGGRGVVYVADGERALVLELDAAGPLLRTWAGTEQSPLIRPRGLAADGEGRVYVVDAGLRQVWRLDEAGADATWRRDALWPTGAALQEPIAVAVDAQENLYVLDPRGGGLHVLRPRHPLFR